MKYSASKCRSEVNLYKKMYKFGKEANIPDLSFEIMKNGYSAAVMGYIIDKNGKSKETFKEDCKNFAKTAEKFNKIFGDVSVPLDLWKRRQNLEKYLTEGNFTLP